jgi:thymidylate synthase
MQNYLDLLQKVLEHGAVREDRTGIGTRSLFGEQLRFPLRPFPIVTTKKIFFKAVVAELLWFLRGESNVRSLQQEQIHIWDEWADADGNLGPVYGQQWRAWLSAEGKIDQISQVLQQLKNDPWSRRHLVSAWNVGELPKMALAPCHVLFQFYVSNRGGLSCQLYQRSADVFLGLPFNISSYALLTHLFAQVLNLYPEELIISLGDVHLYRNHETVARTQLTRPPLPLPDLWLNPEIKDLFAFESADIKLVNYQAHPPLKAEIAV